MKIKESFSLQEYSYMKIGSLGAFLVEIERETELSDAVRFAKEKQMLIHILGAGSNSIFSDAGHKNVFIKFLTNDIIKTYQNAEYVNVTADAGTNWDDFVAWTVAHELSGAETLSLIPGTVGACPVQNIGAYGQEVSNIITNVRAFDLEQNRYFDFPTMECGFSYRNSIFKKNPGRFIITKVSFNLKKFAPKIPDYKDLQNYFLKQKKKNPTLKEIRNAVIEIRKSKLPNPELEPNCGSFFENPIVDKFTLSKIMMKHMDMPYFDLNTDINLKLNELPPPSKYKIYAGWLIERAGLKGYNFGKIKIDDKNALILINHNGASFEDLTVAIDHIKSTIKKEFGIDLEVEPNLI